MRRLQIQLAAAALSGLAFLLFACPAGATSYELVQRPFGFNLSHGTNGSSKPDLSLRARFGQIIIVGGFESVSEKLRPAIDQLSGREGTAGELFALAARLQVELQSAGFALARVYLPAQSVGNGRAVQIHIIDISIEGIDKRNIPEALHGRINHHLAGLVGQTRVTTRDVQQAFAMLQLETGLAFKQEVAPGTAADKARLAVSGEGRAWTGSLFFVHTAGYPAQKSLAIGSYSFANPLGIGDRLSATMALARRQGPSGSLGPYGALTAAYQFPLAASGVSFETYGTLAQEFRRSRGSSELNYNIWRGGGRFAAPLVTVPGSLLVFRAGFETMGEAVVQKDVSEGLAFEATQRYRSQGLRAGFLWSYASGGFSSEGMVEGVFGRSRSEHKFDPPFLFNPVEARRKREGTFSKLESLVRFEQQLPWDFKIEGLLRSQQSFGGFLAPNEQLQLLQTVSLVPSTSETVQGEHGYLGRLELSRRFLLEISSGQTTVSPFVFGAIGRTSARDEITDITKTTRGSMYGGGLRLSHRQLTWSLEGYHLAQSGNVRSHRGITMKIGTNF